MTEISRPWDGIVTGDAGPYSDDQWALAWRAMMQAAQPNSGPLMLSHATPPNVGLHVQATSPASSNVDVLPGGAVVQGTVYLSDDTETLAIAANASGNPRIDTIVLTKDWTAQTIRLEVEQGTPAATPAAPALTQTDGVQWQIPLADIAVANGFATLSDDEITPRAEWANLADGVYLYGVLNNSGNTLETGDVVVWDSSADRAVTTSTTRDDGDVAGVWQGRVANGDYGRVLVDGIGYVKTGAAVSRGDGLIPSTTATEATSSEYTGSLGIVLETTSGGGLALAYVHIRPLRHGRLRYTGEVSSGTTGPSYTNGADRTVTLNTEVYDPEGLGSLNSNQITLKAGKYRAMGQVALRAPTAARLKLYDTTGAAELLKGVNAAYDGESALVFGEFEIDVDSVIELRVRVNNSTAGIASSVSDGTNEIHSALDLERVYYG